MRGAMIGPLGGLRSLPGLAPGSSASAERTSSSWTTLGGRNVEQSSPRARRTWEVSTRFLTPADAAYLTALARRSVPGPLYLHTDEAAMVNLLPSDVAAPCEAGTTTLGATAGTVLVSVSGVLIPLTGVVQAAAVGAWSAIIPVLPSPDYALSAWASAVGAAIEWRTVSATGTQIATGTLTAAGTAGGFRASTTITTGPTVAGVQLRTAAGSRTVSGIRLTAGPHLQYWLPGMGVPQVVVGDPQQTIHLVTSSEVRSDYTITLREVG